MSAPNAASYRGQPATSRQHCPSERKELKMKRLCYTGVLLTLSLLSACSPNDNAPPKPKLFEQERNVLDKSKAVDALQQQQTDEQKQAIDKQAQ